MKTTKRTSKRPAPAKAKSPVPPAPTLAAARARLAKRSSFWDRLSDERRRNGTPADVPEISGGVSGVRA